MEINPPESLALHSGPFGVEDAGVTGSRRAKEADTANVGRNASSAFDLAVPSVATLVTVLLLGRGMTRRTFPPSMGHSSRYTIF